ncbi:hypothetical protein BDY24DRAFT_85523 [Mrakia frigida]|uniref:uncharacterized protein n=1 Tax=Mrakia frigida TaxID=29902 RepID=UPI003FCC23C3
MNRSTQQQQSTLSFKLTTTLLTITSFFLFFFSFLLCFDFLLFVRSRRVSILLASFLALPSSPSAQLPPSRTSSTPSTIEHLPSYHHLFAFVVASLSSLAFPLVVLLLFVSCCPLCFVSLFFRSIFLVA